jgi:redox-sensitive bicupin YhaK (pirin superfamily)
MKKLKLIQSNPKGHWVGDGFPVRTLFSYDDLAQEMSPFLLLDYAGPRDFTPTEQRRGVGEHPHRGFETVTLVYQGEVEHRDSGGGGGKIGPGEVQWMTAASGVVHEEFHSEEFSRRGGPFEVVQLWVNLPAKDKMSQPSYQALTRDQIPEVALPEDSGQLRVIAGDYSGHRGPARTFTPMNVWDIRLKSGKTAEVTLTEGHTAALFVLRGSLRFEGGKRANSAELALFEREGSHLQLKADDDTTVLLLSGEPLHEPIVGYGPFVMSNEAEIRQAIRDYQSGRMGRLSPER